MKRLKYYVRVTRNGVKNGLPLKLRVGDVELEEVTKYLCTIIDNKFTFKAHVNGLIKIMDHKLYLLTRIRKFLDKEKAILIYKLMIVPYRDHAHFLIDSTTQTLSKRYKSFKIEV